LGTAKRGWLAEGDDVLLKCGPGHHPVAWQLAGACKKFAGFQTETRVTDVTTRTIEPFKRSVRRTYWLAALLLAAATEAMGADKATPGKPLPNQMPEVNAADAWQRRIPEMVGENLPLGEVIKELRQRFPEINFLIKQQAETEIDVASIPISMSVRAVTLPELLKALEVAAQRPIQITGAPEDRMVVFESKAAAVAVDAAGLPLRPLIQTRVFNIGSYLSRSGKEENEALAELDDVMGLTGKLFLEGNPSARPFKPRLHIHRGTRLLIAVGSTEELNVIQQVVDALDNSPGQRKAPSSGQASKPNPIEPPDGNKR
jgi:hypothetical protein